MCIIIEYSYVLVRVLFHATSNQIAYFLGQVNKKLVISRIVALKVAF